MNLIENSFLNNLINQPNKISNLKFKIISDILQRVKEILEEEIFLLEFNFKNNDEKAYIIGDIHGNLETLTKLIEIIKQNDPKIVIFLGDIVDRGPKQLECLIIILALKILSPSKYFILRGNHETLEINKYYGFLQDFVSRFRDSDKFSEILGIYNLLPICAVINRAILCLHGGIPQDFDILKKLKGHKCKDFKEIFNLNMQSIYQIMWNDPKAGLKGFSDSFRGQELSFLGMMFSSIL